MAQWWEHSRPANVTRVRFTYLFEFVGFLLCSNRFFSGYSGFPLLKIQPTIWSELIWFDFRTVSPIIHFTVMCLVTWPVNESEAGVDFALIETSLPFLCKLLLISMTTTTTSLTLEKERGLYHIKGNTSLTSFKGQVTKHTTVKRSIGAPALTQLTLQ